MLARSRKSRIAVPTRWEWPKCVRNPACHRANVYNLVAKDNEISVREIRVEGVKLLCSHQVHLGTESWSQGPSRKHCILTSVWRGGYVVILQAQRCTACSMCVASLPVSFSKLTRERDRAFVVGAIA